MPSVIIANTTIGCGVSFMENQAGWHHRVPTDAEYEQAIDELNQRRAQYE
jgi:transketolase